MDSDAASAAGPDFRVTTYPVRSRLHNRPSLFPPLPLPAPPSSRSSGSVGEVFGKLDGARMLCQSAWSHRRRCRRGAENRATISGSSLPSALLLRRGPSMSTLGMSAFLGPRRPSIRSLDRPSATRRGEKNTWLSAVGPSQRSRGSRKKERKSVEKRGKQGDEGEED